MARSDLKDRPEWLHQQELRNQRKGRGKARGRSRKKEEGLEAIEYRSLRMIIRDRSPGNLQACYAKLAHPPVVSYFPKFRYHDHRQAAVMRGEVSFHDLPFQLYQGILSHLSSGGEGWTQGSMAIKDQ